LFTSNTLCDKSIYIKTYAVTYVIGDVAGVIEVSMHSPDEPGDAALDTGVRRRRFAPQDYNATLPFTSQRPREMGGEWPSP
jgi:hypothetical protein